MAIPNIYILLNTSGAIQAAELVGGGTINQIGADIEVSSSETLAAARIYTNRVIEYRGEIFVICKQGTAAEVFGYNRGTGLWTSRFNAADRNPVGLFITNTGTTQRLTGVFQLGASALISYTDDGSTWNSTSDIGSLVSPNAGPIIEFNNRLYMPSLSNGVRITEIDPVALSVTDITPPFVGAIVGDASIDMCVYDDRLFVLTPNPNAGTAGSDWELYEFVGGNFVFNTTVTNDGRLGTAAGTRQGQCCLFQDPTTNDLIAICNGTTDGTSTNAGNTVFRLTPSGSSFMVNEITSTVLPAALQPGGRGSSTDYYEDRWLCYVTNETTPGSPEVYLFFAQGPAPGTGFTTYTWNSVGSAMTSLATGPNTNYAMPHQKFGGGGRVNRSTGNQCMIESATAVSGGYRISYRVYGTVSSQTVRLYYDLNQDIPSTQASISAQTGGSGISGGNSVTGITGDDGSTLFTLDWDIVTDGVTNGDIAHLMLDIR